MPMWFLRFYLVAGLITHKAVWEWLKRRSSTPHQTAPKGADPRVIAVKGVKMAILLGLVVQVFLPDVWPIVAEPRWIRVAGTLLYSVGWFVAVAARWQLGDNWADIETPSVLKGQAVVAGGVYRYVRHPIYVGDLLLLVGIELALNSYLVLGVVALIPVVCRRAIREEELLTASLDGYSDYRDSTKRFIPFVL